MKKKWLFVFTVFFYIHSAYSIVEESGTLKDFLLGHCSNCAYDNWASHTSEGIARNGYNDYGPSYFDPQTDGFGGFTSIPSGSVGNQTLAKWHVVFSGVYSKNWSLVDSLLVSEQAAWRYELVKLTDSLQQDTFYILRERLDSSFVDLNVDSIAGDDVIGSFDNGWGVFIFSSSPSLDEVIVDIPHPEDDFLAVPFGLELFLRLKAKALMIAGAGREVCWDTLHPPYDNNKSWSDPSRNGRTAYEICHEIMFDSCYHDLANQLVTLQIHSYDAFAHLSLGDAQVTAYRDDNRPNPPLRDPYQHLDLINFLPRFPVTSVAGDTSFRRKVDQYISLWSSSPAYHYTATDSLRIPSVSDLTGALNNQQAIYSHRSHNIDKDPENFIHIEIDEYPDGLWAPAQWHNWLSGEMPATFSTFAVPLAYYDPLISAIDSAIHWTFVYPDTTAPTVTQLNQVSLLADSSVYLRWNLEAHDRFFDTYLLYCDTTTIGPTSTVLTRLSNGFSSLGNSQTKVIQLKGLLPVFHRYHFALGCRDIWGNGWTMSPDILISDSSVADFTVHPVSADTLEFNWRRQANDSLYILSFKLNETDVLDILQSTQDSLLRIPISDNPKVLYSIQRILRH